jgi:hypothetical protein
VRRKTLSLLHNVPRELSSLGGTKCYSHPHRLFD